MAKIIYIFVNGTGTCTHFCVLNYYFLSPFLLTKSPALFPSDTKTKVIWFMGSGHGFHLLICLVSFMICQKTIIVKGKYLKILTWWCWLGQSKPVDKWKTSGLCALVSHGMTISLNSSTWYIVIMQCIFKVIFNMSWSPGMGFLKKNLKKFIIHTKFKLFSHSSVSLAPELQERCFVSWFVLF